MWYPQNKQELNRIVSKYLKSGKKAKPAIGLIVPHAGYEYSGEIAGKAFCVVKNQNIDKAIIIGPSHYVHLFDALTSNRKYWETPLGKIKLFNKKFMVGDIKIEHSITNQVPFLQKIGVKQIMPLMIGKITDKQAEEIAKKISKIKAIYIFSTDLSHFMPYEKAVETDKKTIKIIEELNFEQFKYIDACGYFPLLILFHLCKIKNKKPRLIEYKNSGDITNDKESGVVGYASFWF